MKLHLSMTAAALLLVQGAYAHHSFAPHYDATKKVDITGVVTEFEERNPHAYVHVKATDADGRTKEWRCESHGVTQLSRNGLTPDMLKPGTELRITGSAHRRVDNECFFDMVYYPDGRAVSVNGPRGAEAAPAQVAQRDSMFGTWMLLPANRPTSGPQFMTDYLNDTAKAAMDKYDPFKMDPTYRCEPVAIRRGWFAPGTPMAIKRDGNNIIIQHEWMDIQRVVHMGETAAPAGTPETTLGYSRGHMEGDTLVVETEHYKAGVLNQFVDIPGKPTTALLNTNQLRTVERITFDKAGNRIKLALEQSDPGYYTRDFPVSEAEFGPSDLEIKPFGCIPEQLQ